MSGAAEIVQRVRPDVLLVNAIDFDGEQRNAGRFLERYLKVGQNRQQPIDQLLLYRFQFVHADWASGS